MNQTDRGSAPSARAIEIRANKHAELFVDAYYSVYDSSTRTTSFLNSTAPMLGSSGMATRLPDCLPSHRPYCLNSRIPSMKSNRSMPTPSQHPSVLPTITITISGQVIFSAQPFPSNFRMPDPKDISPKQNPADAQQALDGLPRVFSQTLILAPSPTPSESSQPISISNYAIVADCF
ncbi:hypothetical protein PSHT_07510, partial [Puccinia striiformis]